MAAVAAYVREPIALEEPRAGLTVEPGLGDAAITELAIADQNLLLARLDEIPEALAWWLRDLADEVSALPEQAMFRVDPYLMVALQRSLLGAVRVLDLEDSGEARRQMRIRLEQMRQVFRDIAEGVAVYEERPAKELARWLVGALAAPQARIAALLRVSGRTFQRWVSDNDVSEPEGEELRRLRIVAAVTNHLRHALTGPGVIAWFERPHPLLGDHRPADLLDEPDAAARLTAVAASARSHFAA